MMANEQITEDEKRIMELFGVIKLKDIPKVNNKTLKFYVDFLTKKLTFPIKGRFRHEIGPFKSEVYDVVIKKLDPLYDDFYGLLVEGRSERKKVIIPLVDFELVEEDTNFGLIDDYKSWFCNFR